MGNICVTQENTASCKNLYFSKSLKPYEHMSLPFSNKWFSHDTCFKLPSKLDYFKLKNSYYLKSNLKYYASKYFK